MTLCENRFYNFLLTKTFRFSSVEDGLNLTEVCEMIDPLPEAFLTFHRHGSNGPTHIQNPIKMLGDGPGPWHSLGLSINDVLQSKFNLGDGNHGLFLHELSFLRAFANDIGFDEKDWPSWLRQNSS